MATTLNPVDSLSYGLEAGMNNVDNRSNGLFMYTLDFEQMPGCEVQVHIRIMTADEVMVLPIVWSSEIITTATGNNGTMTFAPGVVTPPIPMQYLGYLSVDLISGTPAGNVRGTVFKL